MTMTLTLKHYLYYSSHHWESGLSVPMGQSLTLLHISAVQEVYSTATKRKIYFAYASACARAMSVYIN